MGTYKSYKLDSNRSISWVVKLSDRLKYMPKDRSKARKRVEGKERIGKAKYTISTHKIKQRVKYIIEKRADSKFPMPKSVFYGMMRAIETRKQYTKRYGAHANDDHEHFTQVLEDTLADLSKCIEVQDVARISKDEDGAETLQLVINIFNVSELEGLAETATSELGEPRASEPSKISTKDTDFGEEYTPETSLQDEIKLWWNCLLTDMEATVAFLETLCLDCVQKGTLHPILATMFADFAGSLVNEAAQKELINDKYKLFTLLDRVQLNRLNATLRQVVRRDARAIQRITARAPG